MKEIKLPGKLEIYSPEKKNKNEYVKQIQTTISNCSTDISSVTNLSAKIKAQGGWDSFWNKGENIETIAGNLVIVSSVQQRTLDLVVLLIGATGGMKKDYNVILESIDELSKSHSGSVDVLEYLVKIKNTVNDLKERDELLGSLITYSNELRGSIEELNVVFQKELTSTSKSLNILNAEHSKLADDFTETKKSIECENKKHRETSANLSTDINKKHKEVLDIINNTERSLLTKLEKASAEHIKNIAELDKRINEIILKTIKDQETVNIEMLKKVKLNSSLLIVVSILIVVLILSIFI